MTTLNTIIEEEKKEFDEIALYSDGTIHMAGSRIDKLMTWFTTAMQRAYEAGREERDTYWKERVRKTVGKIEESARTQDTSYEYGEGTYEGMMHSIFILKDITNEDNLR